MKYWNVRFEFFLKGNAVSNVVECFTCAKTAWSASKNATKLLKQYFTGEITSLTVSINEQKKTA